MRGFSMPRMALNFRTIAVIGLVLLVLIAGIFMKLRGKTVTGFPAERRDLLQTVVTTGRVISLAKVDVGSQVLGSVAAVRVDVGDRVKGGQVLIQLRDDEARAALAQAEGVVRELTERLKQIGTVDGPVSKQKLGEAEATFRQARSNYERIQHLHDAGIASRADLDEAIRARDVAAGVAERERLQLSNSHPQGSDVKLAEARLNQAKAAAVAARERLAHTVISAPGDGMVIGRKVEVGDVVQSGTSLLVLSQNGRTRITAQIDEKNLGLLRVGQNAVASTDAYPDKSFPVRLTTIVPAVDVQRGTVEARFDIDAPPAYLVPDMTVSVEIEIARHQKVLTIPSETVRDAATAPWVLVVRDDRVVRQNVELGIRGSGASEVKSGLKEGEMLLPASSAAVIGCRVRIQLASDKNPSGIKNNAR
jgi:HlyD family secretion protein